jgi:hypothetical protein
LGFSLKILGRLGFFLSSQGPKTMRLLGMQGTSLPLGGRTPKEERKEETGGEERAPTVVAPLVCVQIQIQIMRVIIKYTRHTNYN